MSRTGTRNRPAASRKAAALRSAPLLRRSPSSSPALTTGKGEATIVLDDKGCCAQVSPSAAALLGRSRSDLRGCAFADLLTAESRPAWDATLVHLRNGGTEARQVLRLRRGRGSEMPVEFVGWPERKHKQAVTVCGTLRPLSEADWSVTYWQAMFESLRDPVCVVDGRGIIRRVNQAMQAHPLWYPRDQVVGRSFFEFVTAASQAALKAAWAAVLKNGQPGYLEVQVFLRNGSLSQVGLSYSRLGQRDEYVVILHDISERAALEALLRERNAALEAISAVTASMVGTLDLGEMLRAALSRACELLGGAGGAIALADGDRLTLRATQGWRRGPMAGAPMRAGKGLIGRVASSGQKLVADARRHRRLASSEFRDQDVSCVALVPLNGRDRIVGVLCVFRRKGRLPACPFTPDDLDILAAIADPLGLAVENARLYADEHARRQKLDALVQVSRALSTGLDLKAVLHVALDEAIRLTGAKWGVVFTVDREAGCFEPHVMRGFSRNAARQVQSKPLKLTQGLNGRACRTRQIVVCDDVRNDPDYVMLVKNSRIASELVIPLMSSRNSSSGEGQVLGNIDLQSHRLAAFATVDLSLLQAVADQVAAAIENAQLYQETLRRAEGLAALNTVAATVSQSLDLETTLNVALDKALEVIGAEAGAITLVDEATDELVMRVHRGWRRQDLADHIRVKLGMGLSGQAVATGQAIVTGNVAGDPRLAVPEFKSEGIQAMVLAPLRAHGKVVGVLSAMSHQPRIFAQHDVALLTAIADQVGVAIDNARLYEAESRRSAHLALINEVARQVTSTLELPDLLNRTAEAIQKSFGYFHVGLYLLDAARNQVVLRAYASEHPAERLAGYEQSADVGIVGYAAQHGQTLLANDVTQEPRYIRAMPEREGVAAELSVPITHGGQVIGVLDAQHPERNAFSPDDVQAMEMLAAQLGIAIQNAWLFEAAHQRVAELTALQEIGLQISASLDIWVVLETIAQNALKLVQADDVHIFLYDAEKDEIVFGTALWKDGNRTPTTCQLRSEGLTMRVLRSAESIVINDAPSHPLYASPEAKDWGVQSIAGFPLRRADHRLGVFTIAFLTPHVFTPDELRVLMLLANQAASALDNARLYEQTRRRLDELAALHEVALAAASTLELAEVVERTVKALHHSLGFEYVGLFLVNRATGTFDLYAHSGTEGDYLRNLRIKLGQGIVGTAAVTGVPLRVGNVGTDSRYLPGIPGVSSEMAVPLKAGERIIGVIDTQSVHPNAFNEDDERLLVTAGGQLAVIIENARLYELERQRRQQFEGLQSTAVAISAELDLVALLQLIADEAASTFDAQAACLLMWNDDGSSLILQASYGLSPDYVEHQCIPREHLEAMRQGSRYAAVSIDDLARQPLGKPDLIEREGLFSAMVAPMMSGGQFKGCLVVYSKSQPRQFTGEEMELAEILASQAGIAIENAHLYAETRRRLDELTILSEVALAGAGSLDLAQVLDRMLEAIRHTLRFETFEFVLLDPVSGKLVTEAAYGLPPEATGREMRLGEGVVGWVAQQRQPLLVPDVQQEPRYVAASSRTQSELAVPLTVGDRVIGVMNVESLHINRFTEDDQRLLLTLAGQLAIIIEKARLHREMHRRLDEVSTLYSFAQQLSTGLDMKIVLDSIVSSLKQVLNCRSANIWLLNPDMQVLEIHVSTGLKPKWHREARLKLGEGIAGQVAATGKPIYVPDTHKIDFIFFDRIVRSLLCVPLIVHERVIGTLAIDSDLPDAFTPDDERLLTIAAAQASVAIENARLYQDLKERAQRLEQAYIDLQAVDRLKDELVQNVSHELRTPLTFIKGYIELLLAGDMGQINERQHESLEIVAEKTNTVTRLVSDIIFLQQIERESLQLAAVDLGEVARRALHSNQSLATEAKTILQAIVPSDLPLVCADRDRLNQVFDNLIGNAVKFSPDGGTITVQLKEDGEMVQVSVSDTGIGISTDQWERIFERFYQVDGSATRKFGGAGLGLAIVKRIVEAHGGRIWVESQVGCGSTFFFTLPKASTLWQ